MGAPNSSPAGCCPIDCADMQTPTRDGCAAVIGRYSLPQTAIAEAGERRQWCAQEMRR